MAEAPSTWTRISSTLGIQLKPAERSEDRGLRERPFETTGFGGRGFSPDVTVEQ